MKRRHFLEYIGGFYLASSFRDICAAVPRGDKFWKLLRKQFLLPPDYHYLNTGGLGSSPLTVIHTVKKMMDREDMHPVPGHDEPHFWKIKEKCAALFGPGIKKEELAFTSTATEGINVIVNGLPLKPGDEIITSTHEHVALNVPLLYKMKTGGIVIKLFEPDIQNGMANVDRIRKLITERTRLIFTSHITCTTGQILPVKEIGELAKSSGVWYALDGVQAFGHMPLNLKDIHADFYAVSGHKWLLGPKRTGVLYVKESLLDILKPSIVGAYSTRLNDIVGGKVELQPSAQRYEFGTQNDALFYGLEAALDFNAAIGSRTIWEHNKECSEMFYRGLEKIPEVEILSPREENYRSSMLTFRMKDRANKKFSRFLERRGFRVRHVPEAELDGIRVSFHIYNDREEVVRLLEEIKKLPYLREDEIQAAKRVSKTVDNKGF